MSRIFLSHSSRDNVEALALRDWLFGQGWNDVFVDVDPVRALVAADRWQTALGATIGRCRAMIFLLLRHCRLPARSSNKLSGQQISALAKSEGVPVC